MPESTPPTPDPAELTRFLNELGAGDPAAEAALMPHVYAELQRVARSVLRGDRPGETLQPTALVNSAYLKLFGRTAETAAGWNDRKHFFVVAARAMRQVVVDHARRRGALKRSAGAGLGDRGAALDEGLAAAIEEDDRLLDIDAALSALEELEPRQARVVELRYFAGFDVSEVAEILKVGKTTVERDWRFARAWLAKRLGA